ncbi:unnamed protein product [Ectocarpus sp. CCAP 1310/34]|nr:unnamed protein product [Ectocarpus sp. CCAP 1310/34]
MNLVYKGMLFEALLAKVRDSHRLGHRRAKFTWKTRAVDYITEQKPLFESVRKKWLQLPQESRMKYRCANYLDAPFPTESTARYWFNECRTAYDKHRQPPKVNDKGRFWTDYSPVFESILKLMESSSNDGNGDAARDDATDRVQQAKANRMAARRAQQEARGNVTAIMESLQDQAQSLGGRNVEDGERAE